MSPPLTLNLPLPPNIANARMHWAVKNKKRQAYMLECDVRRASTNPRAPKEPPPMVKITVAFRVYSLLDLDNLTARAKWPLDWMKTRGYITDDSPKYLEWAALPTQLIDRKNPGLTITLEEI